MSNEMVSSPLVTDVTVPAWLRGDHAFSGRGASAQACRIVGAAANYLAAKDAYEPYDGDASLRGYAAKTRLEIAEKALRDAIHGLDGEG